MIPRNLVLDTETCGLRKAIPPATGVVQVAYVELDASMNVIGEWETLVNPGMPIEDGASEIHGIYDHHVEMKKPLHEVFHVAEPMVFIAHNKRFDWPRLADHIDNCVGSICTMEAAKRFLKGQPSNKLLDLIRHFGLEEHKAHDALGDVRMATSLLKFILQDTGMTFQQLLEAMAATKIPTEMPFGKHKGKKFTDLPSDYIVWLLSKSDIDPGLKRALETQRRIRGNV